MRYNTWTVTMERSQEQKTKEHTLSQKRGDNMAALLQYRKQERTL